MAKLIDGKTLEHEFDPQSGDMGRAISPHSPPPRGWGGQRIEPYPSTSGISPEQVDLEPIYQPFRVGEQEEFPVYAASGGLTPVRWRAWWREEKGHYFCIVFEDLQPIARLRKSDG